MANRRTRKEIMARIQAIVNAVGKEGLAEKYGFVPEIGTGHNTYGNTTNYLPSADIADLASFLEESNGTTEILTNVLGYEYQADYDGEWGEIEIDFEMHTEKILYIAELDTTRSHKFANKAIEEILNSDLDDLPKQKTIAFPK